MYCGRPRLTVHCALRTRPAVCKALPWLRPAAVAGLLPTFGPGPVRVNFVLDTVALSLSFHHCSVFSCIYILLPPEGQIGEAWEPSKKQCPSGNRRASDSKVVALFKFSGVMFAISAVYYKCCMLCAISAVCCVLSVLCAISAISFVCCVLSVCC